MEYPAQREETAYFMGRLYETGLTTTSGGNISCRLDGDRIAVTPSALDKARLRPEDIGICTLEGENLTPHLKMSSETGMHREIYRRCPEVQAIIHAHPLTATAFAASRRDIETRLISESYCLLGRVVRAPYFRTNTPELSQAVGDAAEKADCILMENHGITTLGADLLQAFDRMELLENAAKMTLLADQLGGGQLLNEKQLKDLDALMGR